MMDKQAYIYRLLECKTSQFDDGNTNLCINAKKQTQTNKQTKTRLLLMAKTKLGKHSGIEEGGSVNGIFITAFLDADFQIIQNNTIRGISK